jgi:hypothetical protein
MTRAPIQNRARSALVAALCAAGCALPGRTGRDESERIDAITLGRADLAEERAFAGLPPPATSPNRTPSILESSPRYEIRPDLRRAGAVRLSGRSRKSSNR